MTRHNIVVKNVHPTTVYAVWLGVTCELQHVPKLELASYCSLQQLCHYGPISQDHFTVPLTEVQKIAHNAYTNSVFDASYESSITRKVHNHIMVNCLYLYIWYDVDPGYHRDKNCHAVWCFDINGLTTKCQDNRGILRVDKNGRNKYCYELELYCNPVLCNKSPNPFTYVYMKSSYSEVDDIKRKLGKKCHSLVSTHILDSCDSVVLQNKFAADDYFVVLLYFTTDEIKDASKFDAIVIYDCYCNRIIVAVNYNDYYDMLVDSKDPSDICIVEVDQAETSETTTDTPVWTWIIVIILVILLILILGYFIWRGSRTNDEYVVSTHPMEHAD